MTAVSWLLIYELLQVLYWVLLLLLILAGVCTVALLSIGLMVFNFMRKGK